MKKFLTLLAAVFFALMACSCASSSSPKKKLPSREVEGGDLPWDRPASWEGGLPGMGGIGNPIRY